MCEFFYYLAVRPNRAVAKSLRNQLPN